MTLDSAERTGEGTKADEVCRNVGFLLFFSIKILRAALALVLRRAYQKKLGLESCVRVGLLTCVRFSRSIFLEGFLVDRMETSKQTTLRQDRTQIASRKM